jgi:XTP/dITP diphosphohydrolase
MNKLVFATNNANKLAEVRSILEPQYTIISLKDLDCYDEIPETANTLQGNALLKATYIHDKFGLSCFADDTGLEVEELNGHPGVYSARFAGEENNSFNNINKVLSLLGDKKNRKACFRTVIALKLDNRTLFFEGKIKGDISLNPKGDSGFGYDPIFVPEGYLLSFAQLSADKKNQISHRRMAINKLIDYLQQNTK